MFKLVINSYSCGLEGTNYSRNEKYVSDPLLLKVTRACLQVLVYTTLSSHSEMRCLKLPNTSAISSR